MRLWLQLSLSLVILFEALVLVWWRIFRSGRHKNMTEVIRAGIVPAGETSRPVVLIDPARSSRRGISTLLRSLLSADDPDRKLTRRPILCAAAAFAGSAAGYRFAGAFGSAGPVIGGICGALIPVIHHARKRRKRLALIEQQFPEALDCLSRSLRAGNAFSVAIELVAEEMNDPLKTEIRKVTRELALGARVEDALNGMIARVPLIEVRFFASAVLLQRETGGNLSEVISNLAAALRERFKLRGQVRAATGQGRLTAYILTVLPVAMLLLMNITSPDYLHNLTDDPLGRRLLVLAAVFQVIGYLAMKRIISFEV